MVAAMRVPTLGSALAIACGVAAAACSGAEALGPTEIAGEYVLVSVGGNPVPVVVMEPGGPRTFRAGSLTLGVDQHFVKSTDIERCLTSCTLTRVVVHGTWSVLPDGSLRFDGDAGHSDPPPLVIADGRRITFCAGAAGEPCVPELVFER
jgi:hypothetical protein